jgi:hypothetical protein
MAATLDPRNKHQYFTRKWGRKYMTEVKQKTESMFEEFKLIYEADRETEDVSDIDEPDRCEGFDINEWRFGGGVVHKENELLRYLKSPLLILGKRTANEEFNVLAWWKANQEEYPILSRIAIERYAIPGMSAEVERVFSGFKPLYLL